MTAAATETTAVPERHYEIAPFYVEQLVERLKNLAARAEKLGCEPPTWTVGEPRKREKREGGIEAVCDVTVRGGRPRFAGWTFVARLERFDKGVLTRAVPGETVPERYRDAATALDCDHCGANRIRNSTYLVRHQDGRHARVGSTCLKDFLGHDFPTGLARLTEALSDFDVLAKGLGGGAPCFDLTAFLAVTAAAIREGGWVSRSEAYDSGMKTATADLVLIHYDRLRKTRQVTFETTADDRAEAEAAVAWAVAVEPNGSDYLHNVKLVAESGITTDRTAGIAASIVPVAARERGRAVAGDLAESRHFGTIDKRETFEADCIGHFTTEGYYGTTHIYKFVVAGNAATWFSSKRVDQLEPGRHCWLTGTVKKHTEYKGVPETHVTRCKVAFEAPAAKRRRKK